MRVVVSLKTTHSLSDSIKTLIAVNESQKMEKVVIKLDTKTNKKFKSRFSNHVVLPMEHSKHGNIQEGIGIRFNRTTWTVNVFRISIGSIVRPIYTDCSSEAWTLWIKNSQH